MIGLWLRKWRRDFQRLRSVAALRAYNPGARIGLGVVVIGDPRRIRLGNGTIVEDGVMFEMQYGGEVVFGERATIRSGAIISPYGGMIQLGNDCAVQHYAVLYGHGGLSVGNFVMIAAHCLVVPANHGIDPNGTPIHSQPLSKKGIRMGNDIWVGGGVRIMDGVVIGDGAVIAAGAVVTNDVTPNMIFGGVPAKPIRSRMAGHTGG